MEEGRTVPREGQLLHPILLGALDEHGQIVPVDIVPGDDVGIQFLDQFDETLDDLALVPAQDASLDFPRLAVDDPDAEDVAVPDRVLDVETDRKSVV